MNQNESETWFIIHDVESSSCTTLFQMGRWYCVSPLGAFVFAVFFQLSQDCYLAPENGQVALWCLHLDVHWAACPWCSAQVAGWFLSPVFLRYSCSWCRCGWRTHCVPGTVVRGQIQSKRARWGAVLSLSFPFGGETDTDSLLTQVRVKMSMESEL